MKRRGLRRLGALILSIPLLLLAALILGILLDRTFLSGESVLYPRRYAALVEQNAEKWGVPESVIYAVIRTESGFDENAVSRADAKGLMQLTEDTYEWLYFLRHESADLDTIMIPSYNIDAGVQLLSWLYERYGRWDTVYAAYNAGYSRVNHWLEDSGISEGGVLVRIPIAETESYVRVVSKTEEMYRTLYGY